MNERNGAGQLSRWLRATFEFNPAFPLSALALLVGLRLLVEEGGPQAAFGEALLASGILQAYEALLLGVALLILWPRKVAYETTAILIILGVVRFATPFMAARLAGEGELGAALVLGGLTWILSAAKVELAARRLRLAWSGRERAWDLVLLGVGCVALPVVAERLATLTGSGWSHDEARLVQLGAWWTLAALLAPLALGKESLGDASEGQGAEALGPLRSRRPALVWRGVTFVGIGLLACNALWIGGALPTALAIAPLVIVAVAVGSHLVRSWGGAVSPHFAHLPALVLGLGILGRQTLRRGLPLSESHALVLLALALALLLPILVRERRLRRAGARSLALVAAAAPLPSLPATGVLGYLFLASLVFLAWNLRLREDRPLALSIGVGAFLLVLLGLEPSGVAIYGALVGLALLWRAPEGLAARRLTCLVACAPGPVACLFAAPGAVSLAAFVAGTLSAGLLAYRHSDRRALHLAWISLTIPLGRTLTLGARPAHLLLGAAFAGIPLGTWLALRRESEARAADAALFEDPRFEDATPRPLQEAA